jgi:hypothetical protein
VRSKPFTDSQFAELAEHMEQLFPGYGDSLADSIERDAEEYLRWKLVRMKDLPTDEDALFEVAGWLSTVDVCRSGDVVNAVEMNLRDYLEWRIGWLRNGDSIHTPDGWLQFIDGKWLFTRGETIRAGRGQPVNNGRDQLIQAVYRLYGGRVTRTRFDDAGIDNPRPQRGHFEYTIMLVLYYLDGRMLSPDHIHSIIGRTLKRAETP